jgi:hypothetical protein
MESRRQHAGSFDRRVLADTVGVGAVLWAIGYALGIISFAFVPVAMIGWVVIPVMIPVTAFASFTRFRAGEKSVYYILIVSATWTAVATAFDYVFLVSAFDVQTYYDFDVMLYYALTFLIPALIGFRCRKSRFF